LSKNWAANEREETRIALVAEVVANREQTWLGARASGIVERSLTLKIESKPLPNFPDVLTA
jgi:hypothetical protein